MRLRPESWARLCQDVHLVVPSPGPALVHLDHAVDYGYVAALDIEYDHLSHAHRASAHMQEQDVPAIVRGLHAAAKHNNYLLGAPRFSAHVAALGQQVKEREQGLRTGDSLPVHRIRPFQIIRAEVIMRPAVG